MLLNYWNQEALLVKLEVDPHAWVQKHAPGLAAKTKRRLAESHRSFSDSEDEDGMQEDRDGFYGGGAQQVQRRGGADSYSDEDSEGSDETARMKKAPASTRSGRAVLRPRPADQIVSHHEDGVKQSGLGGSPTPRKSSRVPGR